MRLTRRRLVAGAAAGALGATGVYELVDRLATAPTRAGASPFPPEQHLLGSERLVVDNGVDVVVPPLHHQVVTAKLRVADTRAALRDAQRALGETLAELERPWAPSAGIGITVAWGLPYFHRFVPRLAEEHLPVDRRASRSQGEPVRALLDAIRFPSDPDDVVLEDNDLAVLLRGDSSDAIRSAARALFDDLALFEVTSIRKGFAGGGFDGGQSLPKKMAVAAGIPGADLIPDTAELFLGFTSTQKAGLGPPRIANFETLGFVDLGARGYFRNGTHLALSHIFEDLEAWYLDFDFGERVATTFRPGLRVASGTQTVPQGPEDVTDGRRVAREFARSGRIGHSSALQSSSRLHEDVVGEDGTVYRKGTAIPHRADFNTLDNPFFWSSRPDVDGMAEGPAAGVHFVVFNPTSDDFRRNRLAMDGVLPDGKRLPLERHSRGQGFNAVLRTTHRQNFLVPPRRHRSFPLVELIA